MKQKISQSGLRWLVLSILVIALDHLTKLAILKHYAEYEVSSYTPFFNLTLAFNKGAAFSFLSAASGWQAWFFGGLAFIISAVLIVWLKRISYQQYWLSTAISLIIGGALGNLWDRLSYGYVVDFLQFHWQRYYFPTFNVADSCICVGAFMLMLDALIKKKK